MAKEGDKSKGPAHIVRLGRVQALVFENDGADGVWYSVTLSRLYHDQDGGVKTAQSLGRDDLLVAGEVLRQAYLWVARQPRSGPTDTPGPTADRGRPAK